MAGKITTDWVRIATAGETVDGRTIEASWITDMAETYNSKKYAALIWPEHTRWGGNYGEVLEVKAEEVEGETTLFARLSPNSRLVFANEQGQMLYTSIEVHPDFQKTGKAYLIGLAVTDSPASTGTDKLSFNQQQQGVIFSTPLRLEIDKITEEKAGLFHRLFSSDKPESKEADMTPEERAAFAAETATALAEQLQPMFSALAPLAPEDKQGEEAPEMVTLAQYNQLDETLQGLKTEFEAFKRQEPQGQEPHGDHGTEQVELN
ncbi:GPO family capsid scaffolding protein [Photobacterium sp. S4TG1]|uniref:GPO family capsid scaffolding protein n=1 Tax=Photobacterium sp. S4TG1 TaxID=3114587 RepID=UPI002E16F1EB|nr:GPO family capsid scaffolding protein [Photobacterium sp. S4TG1]